MPLYEFYCEKCKKKFEQITSLASEDLGRCPTCNTKSKEKLISKFSVSGRGDVREHTMHGCHDEAHGPHKKDEDSN